MSDCSVSVGIAKKELDNLKRLDERVLTKLFDNFVSPLRLGYTVDELEGKYKPSWEAPFKTACPMRAAMVKFAQDNLLYHYHFGYPFYQSGKDPKYPGNESDGIVHTKFVTSAHESESIESHVIFRVDECHPHPFTIPLNLSDSVVVL